MERRPEAEISNQEMTPEQLISEAEAAAAAAEAKRQGGNRVVMTRRFPGEQPPIQQPRVEIKPPPPIHKLAKSETVAVKVCAVKGHDIIVVHGVKQLTVDGRIIEADGYLCRQCGFNLAEIRGQ